MLVFVRFDTYSTGPRKSFASNVVESSIFKGAVLITELACFLFEISVADTKYIKYARCSRVFLWGYDGLCILFYVGRDLIQLFSLTYSSVKTRGILNDLDFAGDVVVSKALFSSRIW